MTFDSLPTTNSSRNQFLSFIETGGPRVRVYKSDVPLSPKQKRALKDWLDLLSISLPPEWALHEVVGDLMENINVISKGRMLEKHKLPRREWSKRPPCVKDTYLTVVACSAQE
jgi:hypothetical protein